MDMIERVARAIAFSAGSAMVGPGESQATREFGWKGDGTHFQQYVNAHWRECIHAASSALEATAVAISERWGEGHPGATAIRANLSDGQGASE